MTQPRRVRETDAASPWQGWLAVVIENPERRCGLAPGYSARPLRGNL